MELYILDKLYRRVAVLDDFMSMIWTERFQAFGDFEVKFRSNRDLRTRIRKNTLFAMSDSERVMIVNEIEDEINDDGEQILTISGPSIERPILQMRVAKESFGSTDPWYMTASPIGIPRALFEHIMGETPGFDISGIDKIPLLTQRFPAPSQFAIDAGVTEVIDWVQTEPVTLYTALQRACEPYDLGFRIIRDEENPQLYFEVFTGDDLTTRQTDKSPVVFSQFMENVQNSKEYTNVSEFANVVYAYTDAGEFAFVGRDLNLGTGHISGLDRKILLTRATVPNDWPDTPESYLRRVGTDILNQQSHRGYSIFEGEINQNNVYQYKEDYDLGDVVEFRNRDGNHTYRHVTEQIFVSDEEGERSYPTLSVEKFQEDDTWDYFGDLDYTWDDFQWSSETWADM